MHFTDYGKSIADRPAPTNETGAAAHARACQKDDGLAILLTGRDVNGRRFTRTARSVSGAYFTMRAMYGLERAWHVRDDGTRRLICRR